MLSFPNSKINIGLNIVEKRSDGFHNIETVFYPLRLCDLLEVVENKDTKIREQVQFVQTGIPVDCPAEKNLCLKAYSLLQRDFDLPAVKMHLHKIVPFGAGLGGGSSDAAFTLKAINELFNLNLTVERIKQYATQLGSDCAFFVEGFPAYAQGKGELLKTVPYRLAGYHLVVVKPDIPVSTAGAYAGIIPHQSGKSLHELFYHPVEEWKQNVANDFEENIFKQFPEINEIKNKLYESGAIFAAMSGSGSSVYGIFESAVENIDQAFPGCFLWKERSGFISEE